MSICTGVDQSNALTAVPLVRCPHACEKLCVNLVLLPLQVEEGRWTWRWLMRCRSLAEEEYEEADEEEVEAKSWRTRWSKKMT